MPLHPGIFSSYSTKCALLTTPFHPQPFFFSHVLIFSTFYFISFTITFFFLSSVLSYCLFYTFLILFFLYRSPILSNPLMSLLLATLPPLYVLPVSLPFSVPSLSPSQTSSSLALPDMNLLLLPGFNRGKEILLQREIKNRYKHFIEKQISAVK